MIEYRLLLPKQHRLFDTDKLRFTINHIKSRIPSVLYFIFHCYDITNTEILVDGEPLFTSPRGVIGSLYSEGSDFNPDYTEVITIPDSVEVNDIVYVQLEIRTLGVDSENPLYFAEMMLEEGDDPYDGYHEPYEMEKMNSHSIELTDNMYANLYDNEGNYLQVIRPKKEPFNTNKLDKAQYTILAPHFAEEDEVDRHIAVFLEAMNQTEQKIDVLR